MAIKKICSNRREQTKLKTYALLKRKSDDKLDIDSKAFTLNPDRFSDAINYYIYDGKPFVDHEYLSPMYVTPILQFSNYLVV